MAAKKERIEKAEKSEMEVLHPDVEVAGFRVRPWSFDQFFDMLPLFLRGSEILREHKITLDSLEVLGNENNPKKILSVLTAFRPIVPDVVGLTLGLKAEEVRKMDFDKVISVALVILIQNAEKIKNFSGLGKTALKTLVTS